MNAIVQTACKFVTSSIGRKILVAITGACLLLFLVGHLIGNLLIFGGPEYINSYAFGLHSMPAWMLWGIRLGLLVVALVHIVYTITLKLENNGARQQYEYKSTITATLSSRAMIWTGLMILCFLIFHLLQYTVRVGIPDTHVPLNPIDPDSLMVFDCYGMIIKGFSNAWCSGFYIVAILFLFSHLRHGVQSVFQTLGLATRKVRTLWNIIAIAYAIVICGGFISIPLAVLSGILK